MQRLDGAHAKAFIGPQQVADAEHQDVTAQFHTLTCYCNGYS